MSSSEIPNTIDKIDSDLTECNWCLGSEISLDPNLGKESETRILFESAMIQWVLTTYQKINSENPISIDCEEQEVELLQRISSSLPGSILALLPNGKIQNVSRRSSALFKEKFFSNQQNWPDLVLSESSYILCLDSYLQDLPRQLYPQKGVDKLADWDGFKKVIDGLIKSVASESNVKGKINERADSISTIIFELFKNTHDHARLNTTGVGDSIRGLYSRYYSIEELRASISGKKKSLLNQAERYVDLLLKPQSQILNKSKRDLTGFLELSIFDSGPGLAASWLGCDVTEVSPQEQLNAVMECFGKGRSSLSSDARGYGLWKVLEELKKLKGMIRVRTNRVHALRQYAMLEDSFREKHFEGYSTPQVVMLDWRRGLTQKLSDYPSVEGTLISVLLPLGDL